MPRRGLDHTQVVDVAVAVADAEGLDAVTVARVATQLGVRAPSIYNHVDGRPGLVRGIALRATRELAVALRDAATGRAGRDALRAVAVAYRDYAREHPGRYAASTRAPAPGDDEHAAAAQDTVAVVAGALRAFALEGDAQIHAVRAVRSALHGFVTLEGGGGFGLPLDLDRSYGWLVDVVTDGLAAESR